MDVDYDAPQVATGDVALHDHPALHVLAHHEVRAAILLKGGDRLQQYLAPVGRLDSRPADRVETLAVIDGITNDQWERDLSFEDVSHGVADACGLHRLGNAPGVQPLASGGSGIDTDFQRRNVRLRLG